MTLQKIKLGFILCLLGSSFDALSKDQSNEDYWNHVAFRDIYNTAEIISKIKAEYIDEVSVQTLAEGCLSKVLQHPQTYTDFVAKSKIHQDPKLNSKDTAYNFSLAVSEFINAKVSNKADASLLYLNCNRGLAQALDTHSKFYDKLEFTQLREGSINTGFTGIDVDDKHGLESNVILNVFKDSPASKAGLHSRDTIIAINETMTKGLTADEITTLLEGEVGSMVSLRVQQKNTETVQVFNLTRSRITRPNVAATLVAPNYGYIRIESLSSKVDKEFYKAISDLFTENKGALNGLILDLRANEGGLLDKTISITSPFLPRNSLIAEAKGRIKEANQKLMTYSDKEIDSFGRDPVKKYFSEYKNLPLVVLIDNQTASGSEIIAAAFKDSKRATIMGQSSYGSYTIQTIYPMHSGEALKITTAEWVGPTGNSIKKAGVLPDIQTEVIETQDFGSAEDTALNSAIKFLTSQKNSI